MERFIDLLIKKPAFSSLNSISINWRKLNEVEYYTLKNYFSEDIIKFFEKKIDENRNSIIGYYKTNTIFIKILSNKNIEVNLDAERITNWLDKKHLSVNPLIENFPKKIKKLNLWIFAYDFIDYKIFIPKKKQLYLIGQEIGKMHILMKRCPLKQFIRKKGFQKNRLLLKQLEDIKSNKIKLNFSKDAINLIKNTSLSEYKYLSNNAQMIHGDLNLGNILINKKNNKIFIIDFEDSVTAWISPLYDLAFVIQRFILLQESRQKLALSKALIEGYKSQANTSNLVSSNNLNSMIKLISIRSLLILSNLSDKEQINFKNEINKFVILYNKMEEYSELISDVEKMMS